MRVELWAIWAELDDENGGGEVPVPVLASGLYWCVREEDV